MTTRKRKKILFFCYFISLLLFPFLCLMVPAYSGSFISKTPATESSIFNKANELYKQGKYADAISEYRQIEKMGFESGNLFYNLGNCYFKTSRLGEAILYYEKAKRFLPRDSDLKLKVMSNKLCKFI